MIAKRLVNLKFISLVNLIMDKEVVTELLQDNFNPKRLKVELQKILDENHRKEIFMNYFELEKMLGGKGASDRIAKLITSKE
jgi:lipid-A-disaccharide synthase